MGKLSLYHYVLLAVGMVAGLFIVCCSFLRPDADALVYSVREKIEITQTNWVRQNGKIVDRQGVVTYVADDIAGEINLIQVYGGRTLEKLDYAVEQDTSSANNDTATQASFADNDEGQVRPTNEGSNTTTTPLSIDGVNNVLGETSVDSTSAGGEFIVGDHRFREDRAVKNPNRRLTPTPTKEATLQSSHTPTPVPTNTPTTIWTQAPTKTMMPSKTATERPTQTFTPVPTATSIPTEQSAEAIFWSAGFETGNISEWTTNGGWIQQGTTPKYEVQSSIVRSGQYAVKFTINTSSMTSQAAYLFYWNTLPDAAYYSAWYYIPANIDVQHWWNIMQWKSTYNGNSDYSRPVFNLGAGSKQTLGLCYLPDREADKVCWDQGVKLPTDRWFHIETYYDRDKVDGRVIVWQDGVKLFDVSGYPTVLSDGTLHWSVNHYSDDILPNPSSIYLDDIIIAHSPVGH